MTVDRAGAPAQGSLSCPPVCGDVLPEAPVPPFGSVAIGTLSAGSYTTSRDTWAESPRLGQAWHRLGRAWTLRWHGLGGRLGNWVVA